MTDPNIHAGNEASSHQPIDHSQLGSALKLLRDADAWWADVCCILFLAFTNARPSEARLATWDEINWDTATWHIPAANTKSRRPYDLPLPSQAIEILTYAKARTNGEGPIFPAKHSGKCLSTAKLSALMCRLGIPIPPHQIRSSFIHWSAEHPEITQTIVNEILTRCPYRRIEEAFLASKSFPEGKRVMQMWSDYLTETMGPVTPQ